MSTTQRPNILFVFTDQQAPDAMSCTGNADLRTPAMDRLAAEGVRFDKAYCTFPLCTPSRASLFTGLYPHEAGITFNEQSISAGVRPSGIGNLLRAAGYDCGYGGKWHIPWCAPMEDGHGFEYFNAFDDCRLAEDTLAYIRRPRSGPFFVVASFDNPHNICEYRENKPLSTGPVSPPADAMDCPLLPPNFAPGVYEPRCLERLRHNDYTPDDWRRYRWVYHRLVERVDAEIGKILDGLDQMGLGDNTLVIFSSDHGELAGAHQMLAKLPLYDECTRVPLIVRAPRSAGGRVDQRLASNGLDVYATICDYAGVAMPSGRQGRSLRPVVEGDPAAARHDHVVVEMQIGRGGESKGRAVRTERYKYIAYVSGANREQLFDMDSDPGEMTNLAVSARYRDVLQQHRDLLREWCRRTGDNFGFHYTRSRVPFIVPGDEYEAGTGGIPDSIPMLHPPPK